MAIPVEVGPWDSRSLPSHSPATGSRDIGKRAFMPVNNFAAVLDPGEQRGQRSGIEETDGGSLKGRGVTH